MLFVKITFILITPDMYLLIIIKLKLDLFVKLCRKSFWLLLGLVIGDNLRLQNYWLLLTLAMRLLTQSTDSIVFKSCLLLHPFLTQFINNILCLRMVILILGLLIWLSDLIIASTSRNLYAKLEILELIRLVYLLLIQWTPPINILLVLMDHNLI